MKQYPQFQCHKIVSAFKILRISQVPNAVGEEEVYFTIWPADHDLDPVEVDALWMEKNKVGPGGYLVIYADGYLSYSPAKAFEEGYKLLTKAPDSKFDVFMRRFMLVLIYAAIAAGVSLLAENVYERFQEPSSYSFVHERTGATCIVLTDGGKTVMNCIPAAPKPAAPQATQTTIIETEGLFMPESRT